MTNKKTNGDASPIRYTLVPCPLGRLLLAATERGVCTVGISDDDTVLEAEAAWRMHPRPRELHRDDAGPSRWAAALPRHLKGELPQLDLPIDVRATAFQRRVWQELLAIPYGDTRSYSGIALEAGPADEAARGRNGPSACATSPRSRC